MTEKQLIELQESTGRGYMMLVGQFYHAYQGAAFALARVTGYKVRRMERRSGPLYMLGFNMVQLDKVIEQCAAWGITVKRENPDGLLYSFEGGDTSVNEQLVSAPKPKPKPPPPSNPPESPPPMQQKAYQHLPGESVRIYAKAVQLQNLTMELLNCKTQIARKYRYTVIPELMQMATRMVEMADLIQLDYGQQRMERAKQIAAVVRTYATTVGNLRLMNGLTSTQETQVAILVEAIETEAKAKWWESKNKQCK